MQILVSSDSGQEDARQKLNPWYPGYRYSSRATNKVCFIQLKVPVCLEEISRVPFIEDFVTRPAGWPQVKRKYAAYVLSTMLWDGLNDKIVLCVCNIRL